jgi:hypothetical protein
VRRSLRKIETALQTRLHAKQGTVMRPAQVMVFGEVDGDAVFGLRFGRPCLPNDGRTLTLKRIARRCRANLKGIEKSAHVLKIWPGESPTLRDGQLIRQSRQQLVSVACPFGPVQRLRLMENT